MNLKFRHKVFLAFLLNSLLIVVCMLQIGRYFAERHFGEYVGKVEAERTTKLLDALGQEYQRSGNWDSVLRDPGLWFGLRWAGPGRPPGAGMTGPPLFPPGPERERVPPPPGELIPLPPGPPPQYLPIAPIALFDAEKKLQRSMSGSIERIGLPDGRLMPGGNYFKGLGIRPGLPLVGEELCPRGGWEDCAG